MTIPVPALKPGYQLKCIVTRERFADAESFPFQEIALSSVVPVRASAVFVCGDVDRVVSATSLSMRVAKPPDVLYCVESNLAPYRYEPSQQSLEEFLPIVWPNDKESTWDAEARDYLELIKRQR